MWRGAPAIDVPVASGRVLELGCGNGKTARALVATAQMVVGVDFSRPGLTACRRSVQSTHLHLVEGDVLRLPFAEGTFDGVMAVHVLGHLMEGEREEAMAEVRRVLVPGGHVTIRCFSLRDMRGGRGMEVETGTYVRGNGIPTHFFSREEMAYLTRDLIELSLTETIQKKKFHGTDQIRAEWTGTYQTDFPMR